MEELFPNVGIGAIFTLLVLKEAFNFVGKKRNGNGRATLELLNRQQSERQYTAMRELLVEIRSELKGMRVELREVVRKAGN